LRILVFGGCGFVGLNIAEAMLAAGHEVVAFDRAPPPDDFPARATPVGRFRAIAGDVTDRAAVARAMRSSPDVVVLGAAITAGPEREARQPEAILAVNLLAQVPILEEARAAGVKRILNLSSAAAYGAAGFAFDRLRETTPCDPGGLYAVTKFASERVAARLAELWSLDLVSVRLSAVFGPWEAIGGLRDTPSPQAQILAAAKDGRPALLERPGLRDWIYAPDVAAAVRLLVEATGLHHKLYNISAPVRWSALAWGEALARRRPGFICRLADGDERPTIDLHSTADRAPLDTGLLAGEFGWSAAFGCETSVADMLARLQDGVAVQ